MKTGFRPNLALLRLLAIAGFALPFLIYWATVGRVPQISAAEARKLIASGSVVVVDVSATDSPLSAYMPNRFRWPLESVLKAKSESDVPPALLGRPLLLICAGGIRSTMAAAHLRKIGIEALSLRSGWQGYIAAVPGCAPGALFRSDPAFDTAIPAFRASPMSEQFAAVFAFFGVKTLYTLIAFWIIVLLWRRKEADLAALRWSMITFTVSELCCFVNVMAFFEDSVLLEHLHSAGMVFSLAFAAYALLEGLDSRMIHYSDSSRCAAAALCRVCVKHTDAACGLRRMFLFLVPATAVLAAVPLFSSLRDTVYNTRIFGLLHSYRHPIIHQLYEIRFLPVAAILILAACFIVLRFVEHRAVPISKMLFSAGAGAVGFSYFRLVLVASFVDAQVWFAAWEEITELLFVGVIAVVLLVFNRVLGGSELASAAATAESERP